MYGWCLAGEPRVHVPGVSRARMVLRQFVKPSSKLLERVVLSLAPYARPNLAITGRKADEAGRHALGQPLSTAASTAWGAPCHHPGPPVVLIPLSWAGIIAHVGFAPCRSPRSHSSLQEYVPKIFQVPDDGGSHCKM